MVYRDFAEEIARGDHDISAVQSNDDKSDWQLKNSVVSQVSHLVLQIHNSYY